MENKKEQLTVRAVPWSDHARELLQGAVNVHDTSGGMIGIDDYELGAGVLFEVEQGGDVLGYYVMTACAFQHAIEGCVVWAAAAPGKGALHLTEKILPLIEQQVPPGCSALTIHTRRRGLVKKLARAGFRCDGHIMRKTLKVQS